MWNNWGGKRASSYFVIIKCKNWKTHPGKRFFRGICVIGKGEDNGEPSFGYCIDICKQCSNERKEMEAYIETLPITKQTPEQIAEQEAEQEKREKLLSELPGKLELIGNLAKHLKEIHKHYKATGEFYVDDYIAVNRLAICEACPDEKSVRDRNGVLRCVLSSCGCHLDNPNDSIIKDGKTRYAALHCDRGYW